MTWHTEPELRVKGAPEYQRQGGPMPRRVQGSKSLRALAVGECMVELRQGRAHDEVRLGFAGDTYNTAVYLRRMSANLGVDMSVSYLTGLGPDAFSSRMRDAWREEGVLDASQTMPGGQPGIYAVATDASGERSFTYWRGNSAAAAMFATTSWVSTVEADLIHFSGISLQIMSSPTRHAFLARLASLRRQGATVSFDTNFRSGGWPYPHIAREMFTRAANAADIVFATFEDEQLLVGDKDPTDTLVRYRKVGVNEVVVKVGAQGAYVADSTGIQHVPATPVVPVDTTAAGDSFAGAYLAGRCAGMTPVDSAGLGAEMAAVVIKSPGAIIPRGAAGGAR